jgi:UDPglucose--hexose-1-phosphate uridylyltransferase
MADHMRKLQNKVGEKTVYCRSFDKADGRELLLYGYAPHHQQPLAQEATEIAQGGELRWHPFRQEWNIYAPHRQRRTFKPSSADDPLAPSRPGEPPTEIPFDDFELAVFENKFTSLHELAPPPTDIDNVQSAVAKGRCDVVVYGPESRGNLHSIGQAKRRLLIAAWVDRYQTLYNDGNKFVMPFENRGDEVGVTLHHPHGQIYAFPFIPEVQQKTANAFSAGYDLEKDISIHADDYGITEAGGLSAFCPPYARFPFETWIAPQGRVAGPWDFNEEQLDGFAHLLGDMTRRYDEYFQRPTSYMLSLHAAPTGTEDSYHFTAQFYPLLRAPDRVKYLASVEQSTGAFTVDVMPDFAAKALRAL